MQYDRKDLLLTCLAAMVGGTLLHFLYDWLPDPVTALFSPVNESLWEHVKIIFWPILAGAFRLTRGRPAAIRPWLLTAPLLCAVMLGFGWFYHITLGGEQMWVDILLFVVLIAAGFWLPPRLSGLFPGRLGLLPVIAALLFALSTVIFTFRPPDHLLFRDLSDRPSWSIQDC